MGVPSVTIPNGQREPGSAGLSERTPWSLLAVRAIQRAFVVLLLVGAGDAPTGRGLTESDVQTFVDHTTREWCRSNAATSSLQVVVLDVHFRAEPPLFATGEGIVVAPLALDLPGAQRVVEVSAEPALLRRLSVQGITAASWTYAGRVHRDMRLTALALVERPPRASVLPPTEPTFDRLPSDLRPEALARAADLQEHGLERCAAFPDWARRTAGPPPYTEQILRLVRAVASTPDEKKDEAEDLCAAIRQTRFNPHRGQVAVVMAARELGIPAFGFASATPRAIHLVGTFTDQAGWILVDIERPDEGWFTGGPPLVTIAPLLGGFSASVHGFWSPEAAAFGQQQWGVTPISGTEWRGRLDANATPTDTTEARTLRLDEVCR